MSDPSMGKPDHLGLADYVPGVGLTFTFVSTVAHCPFSDGIRCPSSTVALSEIVVMSAFIDPSAELACAANGRAARNSASALVRSRAAFVTETWGLVEASK